MGKLTAELLVSGVFCLCALLLRCRRVFKRVEHVSQRRSARFRRVSMLLVLETSQNSF